MPELPEVETCRRGLAPLINQQHIHRLILRRKTLRWPIPKALSSQLPGQTVTDISRRAKYLLIHTTGGTILLHLGMSGHLHFLPADTPAKKHDHVDIVFTHQYCLRFNDPRRFGALLWTTQPSDEHPLLKSLGPEPLTRHFHADYLHKCGQNRTIAIKALLLNGKIVAGIGNIYATEALFMAGIDPRRPANSLTHPCYVQLVAAIKKILKQAIKQGGTTLKDFSQVDGQPGYFRQKLQIYGRAAGQTCTRCQHPLNTCLIAQRNTVYCQQCQH